jgi:hypothetical protein
MPFFERYFGIDYSGAQTPTSSLSGLRIYSASHSQSPTEIHPPPSQRKYWTRRGLAEWLAMELKSGPPTLVGIDHAFSFPLDYFELHKIPGDWIAFVDDFCDHWPTDEKNMYVDFIREGLYGKGHDRTGNARWRRLAEKRCGAKSVFHFDVQGSVAKSTHAGLPWLRFLRQQVGAQLHFWPFDGRIPPQGHSAITEVYPALWSRNFPNEGRNTHQHDAWCVARWMQEHDQAGLLEPYFEPLMSPAERAIAQTEGWILGLG